MNLLTMPYLGKLRMSYWGKLRMPYMGKLKNTLSRIYSLRVWETPGEEMRCWNCLSEESEDWKCPCHGKLRMHWCGIRENGGEPFTRTPRTPRLFPCCLDQVQTVPQVPLDIQSGIIQMRYVGWIGPIWNFNFSSGYSVMLVMIFIVKTWGVF